MTVPAVAASGGTGLAGTLVGVTMAVGGAGNLVGGWLSDRLGRATTVMIALAISGGISATIVVLGGLPLPVQSFVGFFATVISPVVFGVALDATGFGLAFGTLALSAAASLARAVALSRLTGAPDPAVAPA